MNNSSRRLDSLVDSLETPSGKPVAEVVSDYEEAIDICIILGEAEKAKKLIEELLDFFHDPFPPEIKFRCYFNQGRILWRQGDLNSAWDKFTESMNFARSNNDESSEARAQFSLGVICSQQGKYREALSMMENSEQKLRICGGGTLARCLNWLGITCSRMHLFQRAWSYYKEALELTEEFNLRSDQGFVLGNMGLLCQRMDLIDQAEECFRDSLSIHQEDNNKYGIADSTANLGMLLLKKRNLCREAEPLLDRAVQMHLEAHAFVKAGLVLINQALCSHLLGDRQKSDDLFDRARESVFSCDCWSEQSEYCGTRAQVLLETGELDEAEELLLKAMEIHRANLPDQECFGLNSLYAEILSARGDYREAFIKLKKASEEKVKIDGVKSKSMESLINALTEAVRGRKKLQKIQEKNTLLTLSEERFRALVNEMTNIGVLAVDSRGVVTFWNDTCRKFYGYTAEEASGEKLIDLIVPEHLKDWLQSFMQNGEVDSEFEVNLKGIDGELRSVLVSLVPITDNETFVIQVDLTCQRRAENEKSLIEAQLRRTQKLEALGTLTGGIAHDFNNLLQGILGNAAMLCNHLEKGTSEATKAQRIMLAAEKSAELCTQMLDYAGVKPVSHSCMNINNVVKEISTLLETSIPKDVSLVMDLSNRAPNITGDRSQMRQVVMNLVLNGAEAIKGTGEVIISTDYVFRRREYFANNLLEESPGDGDYLEIKVKDTGTGIDSKTISLIFDPFFSTKKTGRGLGLAAVLGIIRGHSGVLMVTSEPDVGTEFSVYIRAAEEDFSEDTVPELNDRHEEHAGKRIMVVDDEEIVRETIGAILSSMGYDAIEVSGGAEALIYLEQEEVPDLMLLDLTMPGLSGADVFSRIRDRGIQIPVLIVSGYSEEKLSSLFPGEKPGGFLQKPFSPDALQKEIVNIFS